MAWPSTSVFVWAPVALSGPAVTSVDRQLRPGAVLLLAEQDYCYGTGVLKLRVESLGADLGSLPRLEWVRIVGRQIYPDGSEQPREVMARVSALSKSVLPASTSNDARPEGLG